MIFKAKKKSRKGIGGKPRKGKNLITYQNLAVYPTTHARIKLQARLAGKSMAQYIDEQFKPSSSI